MNPELKKRLLALLWTSLAAGAVAVLTVVIDVLPTLGLPEFGVVLGILVINQITKTLNKTYKLGSKILGAIKSK